MTLPRLADRHVTDIARLTAALADRYMLGRKLGDGGMATFYLAHDLKHDRDVAVKVLRPELAAVIGAERFRAEIKTTANLQPPHILALFDSGQVDGTVFYVMPFVEGESLRDRLTREKQLPMEAADFQRFDLSRDGRWIAAAVQGAEQNELRLYDLRNGQHSAWLHGEYVRHPLWDPKGETLLIGVRDLTRWSILRGAPSSGVAADTILSGARSEQHQRHVLSKTRAALAIGVGWHRTALALRQRGAVPPRQLVVRGASQSRYGRAAGRTDALGT